MVSVNVINNALTFFCLVGLGLSIYAFFVGQQLEADENYVATCDIGENMKCSNVFKSEYSKGFGLVHRFLGKDSFLYQPNSLLGILFYSLTATLSQVNSKFITKVSLVLASLGVLSSIYFASILIFILKDFCVVCVSTYVVNFINFILIKYKNKQLFATPAKKTGKSGKKQKAN